MNFLMMPGDAEEFFLRVMDLKEDTRENRLKILEDMAKERRVFKQSEEQIKKRLAGKKVINVKHK